MISSPLYFSTVCCCSPFCIVGCRTWVAPIDEATESYRVIFHDPALDLNKQPFPEPACGSRILHVGLNPILQHGPQQATLWLPLDTLGDLGRWSRQERDPTDINTVHLFFHTCLAGTIIKRPYNAVSHGRGRRRALLTG